MLITPPGLISAPPLRVLFLGENHAALSRMAEGFARRAAPEGTRLWSAGIHPRPLDPLAAMVMREIGIDLESGPACGVSAIPWREADSVVLVGSSAQLGCPPVAPDVRRIFWPLPDPAVADAPHQLDAYRSAREELRWRVSSLWSSLTRARGG